MKKCPYCGEEIQDSAEVCFHCREYGKPAEYKGESSENEKHFSFSGCYDYNQRKLTDSEKLDNIQQKLQDVERRLGIIEYSAGQNGCRGGNGCLIYILLILVVIILVKVMYR